MTSQKLLWNKENCNFWAVLWIEIKFCRYPVFMRAFYDSLNQVNRISRFLNCLYCWIYSSYILHKNWMKFFRNQIGLLFHFETILIRFHSFYDSLSFAVTHFHFLSLVVILCDMLYYSLSLIVPIVVIYCTTPCHLLSFDVPLVCFFLNDHMLITFKTKLNKISR